MCEENTWKITTATADPDTERRWFIQQYVMARANSGPTFDPLAAADRAAEVWDKHLKPKEATT